jgi:hypothetical protein
MPIEADEDHPIKCVWPDPPRRLAAQYVELMAENNHLRFEPPARRADTRAERDVIGSRQSPDLLWPLLWVRSGGRRVSSLSPLKCHKRTVFDMT